LRHGAAPSLPEDYNKATDGLAIGPKAGSCGTAAWQRKAVIVPDVMSDPLWEDFRDIIRPTGLRSCWSTPIMSHQGAVLGTFAMYSRDVREPDSIEIQLVDMATRIAGIAIERRLAEERIQHMAHHDALTGLPNRLVLMDRLDQAILAAQRNDRSVTVAFIDLDNFKVINDSLGHGCGDELLKVMASRMVQCVRGSDTVVRLGGDEFVILLTNQSAAAGRSAEMVAKLQTRLSEPVSIDGHLLQVTCSMGLATYPKDGADASTLLMNADAAMYRAKELGRNNYQFCTAWLSSKNQEKLALQEGLRGALAREEFVLLYQPQVDLQTKRIFAAEALIRWQHPHLGLVSPAKFIPVAEETGLIAPIGDWVLRTACRQSKAWQANGARPIAISVNVSARQFMDRQWVARVAQTLQETGLDAKYLELELTESLIMRDVKQAIATMRDLRAMDVQLSIDDFGTGYSSLNALKTFPVARLKLDSSFVRDIPHHSDDNAIAIAVISLGHQLGLKVIAEGVETAEQLQFLAANQCDEFQGYHFSKPVTAAEIESLLRKNV
jgi:diguanylate cyclase (GGDEF)-like protein